MSSVKSSYGLRVQKHWEEHNSDFWESESENAELSQQFFLSWSTGCSTMPIMRTHILPLNSFYLEGPMVKKKLTEI